MVRPLGENNTDRPVRLVSQTHGAPITRIVFGSSVQFMGGEQMIVDLNNPQFKGFVEMYFDGSSVFTLIDKTGKHHKIPRYVATSNVKSWD